jgi:rfaE bifunctional protein kinase chain/domain
MKKYQTAFVSGNFFVLHPGHIRFLRFAAGIAERLVIGVRDTHPSSQYPTPSERVEALQALNLTGEIVLISEPLEVVLQHYKPDVVVKGSEYRNLYNQELDVINSWSGEIVFSSGDSNYSGSELLRLASSKDSSVHFSRPSEFIRRHHCELDRLKSLTSKFGDLRVLVLGDLIVDEYIECEPLGLSREDPTIVISPVEEARFVGGAGIVAAHAQSLGAKAEFITLTGDDEAAVFAKQRLASFGVSTVALTDPTRPTTVKRRYRCESKTMLRVNRLSQDDASLEIQRAMIETVYDRAPDLDLIIFSDFNYGALPQHVVDEIVAIGKFHGCAIVADSQSSSQTGDSSRFRGVTLLAATEYEARIALRNHVSGLSVIGTELLRAAAAQMLLLKLGGSGLVFLSEDAMPSDLDRLPALNQAPVDVAGAGDAMLVAAGLSLAAGSTLAQAAYIGSLAAAIQVSRLGNTPLASQDLSRALH